MLVPPMGHCPKSGNVTLIATLMGVADYKQEELTCLSLAASVRVAVYLDK